MADGPRLNNADKRIRDLREVEYHAVSTQGALVRDPHCVGMPSGETMSSPANSRTFGTIMTRPLERDGRISQYRGEFSSKVHRDWVRSPEPCAIVTEDLPPHVRTLMSKPNELNRRVGSQTPQYSFLWTFQLCVTKPLRNLALALPDNRENFCIKSVTGQGNQRLGTCDGHEWFDNSLTTSPASPQLGNSPGNSEDRLATRVYNIEIGFGATSFGTYRQHLFFGFGDYPVLRRRLCFDFVHVEDVTRLNEATKYILHQTSTRWTSPDSRVVIRPFESPFVAGLEPRDELLIKAYPYPLPGEFFLTHSTLSEDSITPTNYRGRLHELISVEELARHEQVTRYNSRADIKLSQSYILSSDTDGSTTAKYAPPGELFAELKLDRRVSEDMKSGRLLLRTCTRILLKPYNPGESPNDRSVVYQAHVEDKCHHGIFVRLSKRCVDELDLKAETHVEMLVQFVLSRVSFCEWHRAVDCLPDVSIVFPSPNFELTTRLPPVQHPDREWHSLLDKRLNPRQLEAITAMVAPSEIILPPILLLGPYGTGKTFTLAQALLVMLLENPRNKVLLCTQSNSAADLYVKEFFDEWYTKSKNERLKPLRIYYAKRARNTVHRSILDYCPTNGMGHFRVPTKEDVEKSGLVVTTLATSSCLMSLDFEPTHIVIDEAAQALEVEVLNALALATKRTRLILAGDQMQLAPEVYSDLAAERGFGVSLLERIHNLYSPDHPCRIRLCQNYRSHADIIKLTSNLFYGNQIEPGLATLSTHNATPPLMFHSVAGVEQQGDNSTGFYNEAEAIELAEQVVALKRCWPVAEWGEWSDDSIGVLSHYMEQVNRIRLELRKRKLPRVSVERVLNVQGKQFTAVFISTVRTAATNGLLVPKNNINDYGFLTNPRLLNTAITRAKSLVAVIGDPVALLTIGSCRALWGKYLETATIQGVTPEQLKPLLLTSRTPQIPMGLTLNPNAREFVPRAPSNDWLGCAPNTERDLAQRANAWPSPTESAEYHARTHRRN